MASTKPTTQPYELMLVNDVPGEETRIAILEDGHLEELFHERASSATTVGNVYRGRVTNVESAIQAAFIEFGHAQRGFLHISDLHPRYFPRGETKERVGRKTARRDRPLVQDALKRGDEILVQVLKEGIGTKGPTLTSYISIPGRMMVMMPHMDRVGVTRRVEDEDERQQMRKILDTLDLPEDFGFILRTAGMGKSKAELKRDVAYLTRLWKVMERRGEKVGTPCELYTESDVLIRTIRDVLRPSIKAIVVDSDSAYERCTAFLKVIAPRSAPDVVRYRRALPLFHAFGVERQIDLIRSREVPLPSGGALVIESTEALVAIDVNSGRSRSARDSETNAYQTNLEAADEICRQLRLRDLGGLIIHDLIDMRHMRHRRIIEDRFSENLKRDRARASILKISEFGILEMTRQRMRPDLRSGSHVECPSCRGQGEIMAADTVAADIVRHVGYLLQSESVHRLEIVVSPKVASVLLSTRRRHLNAIEERLRKRLDVRVSEAIAVDRVDYYAYDIKGTDLDLDRISTGKPPTVEEIARDPKDVDSELEPGTGRHRRRRRRGTPPAADATAIALSGELARELQEIDREEAEEAKEAAEAEARKKQQREQEEEAAAAAAAKPVRLYTLAKTLGTTAKDIMARFNEASESERGDLILKNHMSMVGGAHILLITSWFKPELTADAPAGQAEEEEGTPTRRRRRRRGGRGRRGRGRSTATANGEGDDETTSTTEAASEPMDEDRGDESTDEAAPARKKRRSRRGRKKTASSEGAAATVEATTADTEAEATSSESAASAGDDSHDDSQPTKKRRRRRRRRGGGSGSEGSNDASHEGGRVEATASDSMESGDATPARKKGTRSRKKVAASTGESNSSPTPATPKPAVETASDSKPKPRRLYGSRRGLKTTPATAISGDGG